MHPHVLRDMALFVEVAKRGSFSRAATALDMPISSLSRRIMLFEAAVGLRLIERTTRKLVLTRHGETYFPRAARLVEEAQATVEEMLALAKGPSPQIRIAAPAMTGILRRIATAVAEGPLPERVQIRFDVAAAEPATDYDLAIIAAEPDETTLDPRAMGDLEVGLYASRAYLDRSGTPDEPHDLHRHEAILVGHSHSAEWRLLGEGQSATVRVGGRIACASATLAQLLAIEGLGIVAAGAAEVADALRDKRLVRLLPAWRLPPTPIRAVAMRRPLPPETRVFLERIMARVGTRAAGEGEGEPLARHPSGRPPITDGQR